MTPESGKTPPDLPPPEFQMASRPAPIDPQGPPTKFAYLARVGIFTFMALAGMIFFPVIIYPIAGILVTAALSTFAAAAVANSISIRIWERGRLSDIGLGWTAGSRRNLLLGIAGGFGAACLLLTPPILFGIAYFERSAQVPEHPLGSFLFVSAVLIFGAIGEEMLFHGYGFQVMLRVLGTFATIIPMGVLFGLAHMGNQSFGVIPMLNTIAWGVLLGWAFVRSGDLWLPIGLHFGWNWALPLFGVNLSGFTMGVTGYALRWNAGAMWSGGEYGPEGSILTLAVVAALFYYLHRAPVAREGLPVEDRGA